jgi:hypothetical protein
MLIWLGKPLLAQTDKLPVVAAILLMAATDQLSSE